MKPIWKDAEALADQIMHWVDRGYFSDWFTAASVYGQHWPGLPDWEIIQKALSLLVARGCLTRTP